MRSLPSGWRVFAPARAASAFAALATATLALASCADDPTAPPAEAVGPAPTATVSAAVAPPAASVQVVVQVPTSMRTSPFNVERRLTVPPNFSIAVLARVPGARFMAVAPNGDVLVSVPGSGAVRLVRRNASGDPTITTYASGLRRPHDIVFATLGGTTYVYIAESHQINRYVYVAGATTPGARQVVVTGLPDASSPELGGAHGHQLKNIAIGGDGKLYVSSASTCNVCTGDVAANPPRAAILQYNADGTGYRVFARGLRNAEGLAFVPGTNTLWAVVNQRDNVPYPHQDATGNYGRVFSSYVDNHPPEAFTRVRDGGNYGWPYCNPSPDSPSGLDDMPFDRDYDTNRSGAVSCSSMDRISKGIQAHSAPLGLSFLQNTAFPSAYRQGAVTALHGSWNRTQKTGYKVAYFPWDAIAGRPGQQIDLVTGWASATSQWGRPVDAVVDASGALLVSDDYSGTIYRLTYTPPPTSTISVTGLTLVNADTDLPITGFDPIPANAVIDFSTIGTRRLNIRADRSGTGVRSVRFALDANANFRTESTVPFALAGDNGVRSNGVPDYRPWTPTIGSHTVKATPYTQVSAGGTAGTAKTVTFTVRE